MGNFFTSRQLTNSEIIALNSSRILLESDRSQRVLLHPNSSPQEEPITFQSIWKTAVSQFGSFMCLFTKDPTSQQFKGITYSDIHNQAKALGSAIRQKSLTSPQQEAPFERRKLKLIGSFASICKEQTILEISNILFNHVMVPIPENLGSIGITQCLQHSGITTCIATPDSITQLAKSANLAQLKYIIAIGNPKQEDCTSLSEKGCNILAWESLIEFGTENPIEIANDINPSDCITLLYTNDSKSSSIKATMVSHKNLLAILTTIEKHEQLRVIPGDVHLSHLPISSFVERAFQFACLSKGAKIYLSNNRDFQSLREEIHNVRPSFIVSVPRIYQQFHAALNAELNDSNFAKRFFVNKILASRANSKNNSKNNSITNRISQQQPKKYSEQIIDRFVLQNMKELSLGDNCRFMLTLAPLPIEIKSFIQNITNCQILETYTPSSHSTPCFITYFENQSIEGLYNTECKIVDVPEQNYSIFDKDENGNQQPRGELCFRGDGVSTEEYNLQNNSSFEVDQEGWMHTGDIVKIIFDNKGLKVIDKKRDSSKLESNQFFPYTGCILPTRKQYKPQLNSDNYSQSATISSKDEHC